MLRNLIQRVRPLSGCICRATTSQLGLQMNQSSFGPFGQTVLTPSLYKGAIVTKQIFYSSSTDSKVISDESVEVEQTEIDGLSSGGMFIPSEETMNSLVGGVPYKELPVANIRASPNNTIIGIFDHTGKVKYSHCSAGMEGYRNAKKRSEVAAQETGLTAGLRAKKKGVAHIRVIVKGIGTGRLPAIKGLKMAGLNIVSLTDNTPIFILGPRPRKARRV